MVGYFERKPTIKRSPLLLTQPPLTRNNPPAASGVNLTFANDTVGQMPAGMTRKWELANSPFAVASVAEASDGKTLRYTGNFGNTNPSGLRAVSIDSLGSALADITILTKFKISRTDVVVFPLVARGAGTSAAISGYALRRNTVGVWNIVRLSNTSTSPTQTTVGSTMTSPPTVAAETWVWAKLQAIGTALKAKAWLASGSEPASWQIDTTDATHANGWAGICSPSSYQPVQDFDIVQVV